MVFFMQKSRVFLLFIIAFSVVGVSACAFDKISTKKTKDIDFTVVAENEMPKEVKQIIEQRKENAFKVTYSDSEYTYIIVGYGKQKFDGYSIKVKSIYESTNAVFVKTEFKGPEEYTNNETVSFPYIVIKIEYTDKNVVFSE